MTLKLIGYSKRNAVTIFAIIKSCGNILYGSKMFPEIKGIPVSKK
jgi:hypothetical protein